MTLSKFKKDFMKFLNDSTVNLGRKNTKTRKDFMDQASAKFDKFASSKNEVKDEVKDEKANSGHLSDRVMRIKPSDPKKALDAGKGVVAMTASESARADEQLGRSPYVGKGKVKGDQDE